VSSPMGVLREKMMARSVAHGELKPTVAFDDFAAASELEAVIKRRLSMFEAHITERMEVCRLWTPAGGLPPSVVAAVRSLIIERHVRVRSMNTIVTTVNAARRWRRKVRMVVDIKRFGGQVNTFQHFGENVCPSESECLRESQSRRRHSCSLPPISPLQPPASPRPSRPGRSTRTSLPSVQQPQSARSASLQPKTTWDDEAGMQDEVHQMVRNLFLAKLCAALRAIVHGDEEGCDDCPRTEQERSVLLGKGVELMHWLCRRAKLFHEFCEKEGMIGVLVCLLSRTPREEGATALVLIRALQTFACGAAGPAAARSQDKDGAARVRRIAEIMSEGVFQTMAANLGGWVDGVADGGSAEIQATKACELLTSIHELVLALLSEEVARNAAADAEFVPAVCELISSRLQTRVIVWRRALPMLIDMITLDPRTEYVQQGFELSRVLRCVRSRELSTIPAILHLRMENLRCGQCRMRERSSCAPSPRAPSCSKLSSLVPTPRAPSSAPPFHRSPLESRPKCFKGHSAAGTTSSSPYTSDDDEQALDLTRRWSEGCIPIPPNSRAQAPASCGARGGHKTRAGGVAAVEADLKQA